MVGKVLVIIRVYVKRRNLLSWESQPLRQSRPAAAARDSAVNASQKHPHACYRPKISSPYKQNQRFSRMINNLEVPINTAEGAFCEALTPERGQPPQDGSDARAEVFRLSDYVSLS